jgi:RTX calcium-binding nonapeptide repeat (4 copies)
MRRARILGMAVACWLALCAGIAEAQSGGSRQGASLRFDQKLPGTPTGVSLDIDYVNPDDAAAKPIPVRTIVALLAAGTQIDTSIPEQCTAADSQLMLLGPDACPENSRVGAGYVRIDTGFSGGSRYIENDLVLFNQTDQLIFLFTERGSGARLVSRCPIEGRKITCSAPPLPGTPPDGAAVDVVQERLFDVRRNVGGAQRGYITTPGDCPQARNWTNLATFGYVDGVSQTVETKSACSPAGGKSGRCANDWNGSRKRDRHSGTDQGDRLFGFQGRDRLRGRGGDDCIRGGRGDDKLRGGKGDDELSGSSGNDRLAGGPGSDLMRAARGADVIVARDGQSDRIHCGKGPDRVKSADATDQLISCQPGR